MGEFKTFFESQYTWIAGYMRNVRRYGNRLAIMTAKITNQDEMYSLYQKYADKYDIPILEYTYMNMCYDTTYFIDALRLNKIRAELFSDSLANDILNLGLLD